MENKSIKEHCHINSNNDDDRFVGIKVDLTNTTVHFPIGYQLPEKDSEIRKDIRMLINILVEFTEKKDIGYQANKANKRQTYSFPINAYLEIINHYLAQNGKYYAESEPVYKSSTRGRTNWSRTIKQEIPLLQANGSLIYNKKIVRISSPNVNNLITQIHKYCVYESFEKLGWLFVSNLPEKPEIAFNKKQFLIILKDKMAHTNIDRNKRLFKSMIDMISFLEEDTNERHFYYGTYYFEGIWEKLIDRIFGITNKKDYFPRTKWLLKHGKDKNQYPLEPDSIMVLDNKYYVLDAKYYRYGVTCNPAHLPNSSSINKQITYGEYLFNMKKIPNKKLFNAFIMPFNMKDNLFGITEAFGNIGEAIADWKKSKGKNYEHIQGIVIDVRYIMFQYSERSHDCLTDLANSIEKELL